MGERVKVLSQTLSNASLQKITLGQDVLRYKLDLFPQNLKLERRADLTLLNDVNGEILSIVTASIQGPEIARRLVLLQKGWKPVVKKLHLKKGDTVSMFLLDRETWTYSIQVEKAAVGVEADQGDADMEEDIIAAESLMSMATSGLQLLAHCAFEQEDDL